MHHQRLMSAALAIGTLGLATSASAAPGGVHASARASAAAPSVSVRSTKYGKILVDSKGNTLYLWAKDKQKNKTVCSDACESVWPLALVSGTPTAGPGVSASMLGSIPVTDSRIKRELTYNGHPLYRFVSDAKPGKITGQANKTFGAPWWLVSPAGTAITKRG
jgi:predicted lipoprotein with Yx(FWY)xxD motif